MPLFWDAGNIDHIARHNILPEEVEQVLENDPLDITRYLRNREERLNQVGETDAGRVLVVVTTQRGEDTRVVTAHPADRDMRALYAQLKEAADAGNAEDTGVQD